MMIYKVAIPSHNMKGFLCFYNFFKSPFISCLFLGLLCFTSHGQVGINTTDPKGTLDITTTNNTGLVIPRVTMIEDVTDGYGNPPVNGTQVFDISRNAMCFYQNDSWVCMGIDSNGDPVITNETNPASPTYDSDADYIKSSNNDLFDHFGYSTALSSDGNTLAVSAYYEASNATGINGDQTNNASQGSGAVYVFSRTGSIWTQQAYIKGSNTESNDHFGTDLALSSDGNTLAVSASVEDSNATGVNGNQNDNSATFSGATYIFTRSGSTWTQQAYLKASNTGNSDAFGESIAMSSDGNTLAVSSPNEDSNATGINGDETNNGRINSGAVYIFTRVGITWSQQAYIKASNPDVSDRFGIDIALSGDGNTLGVGAVNEDSNAIGINGNQTDNSISNSGAVYIFDRTGGVWSQQAYIKASNTGINDFFGFAVAISDDGNTLAVGAYGEDSNTTGIDGDQLDNTTNTSGAVYVFSRIGITWTQQAYLKSSNTETLDQFGRTVALSGDGNTLATGAVGILNQGFDKGEDSNAAGIDGDQTNNSEAGSGAVYVFNRTGSVWTQQAYVKSIDSDSEDFFGFSLSLSTDGSTLAVSAVLESSTATGVNGDSSDDFGFFNGAAYVYTTN